MMADLAQNMTIDALIPMISERLKRAHDTATAAASLPGYVANTLHGSVMSPSQFIINNAGFMAILVALSIWAALSNSRLSAFILMAWASGNLFWDFIVHLTYTTVFDKYSPGLITATLLYYPIPLLVTAVGIREGAHSGRSSEGKAGEGEEVTITQARCRVGRQRRDGTWSNERLWQRGLGRSS